MILSVSDVPASVAVATPFAGSEERAPEQQKQQQQRLQAQQQQQQHHQTSSSLSLQMLVALASTLFDQTTLEERLARKQQEQQQQSNEMDTEDEREHEQYQNKQPSCLARDATRSKPQTINGAAAGQQQKETSSPSITNKNKINKNNSAITTLQTTNFQCCTRQGFLSRLRSVLDHDPSLSDVLSWMPDGKTFTIVSPRKFAKTGMVYELFGIRKMSSFLRRLNQLGFARVRDPTDPTNLDVFRRPGFVAAASDDNLQTTAAAAGAGATTKEVQCLDSPTSTLQFATTMASTDDETDESASSGSSSFVSVVASGTSSPVSSLSSTSTTATSTLTINNSDSTEASSLSSAPSPWVCSTPEPGDDLSQQPEPSGMGLLLSSVQPSVMGAANSRNYNHPYPITLATMPPSMPASSRGGPVLLRSRRESYDDHSSSVSSPPSVIAAALLHLPPKPVLMSSEAMAKAKTPKTNNRRHSPMLLSPGTLQILELPNLYHVSSESEAEPEKRNEGVDECRQDNDDRMEQQQNVPPNYHPRCHHHSLGMIHTQKFPTLQPHHQREYEYRSLYRAAENEADAVLKGNAMQWFGPGNGITEQPNRIQWNRMRMHSNRTPLEWHKNQYNNGYNTIELNGMYVHRMIQQKRHGDAQSNGI
jgi:hypothetical protein